MLRGPPDTEMRKAPENRGRGPRTVLGGGAGRSQMRTSGEAAGGGRRNHAVQFGGCSIQGKG